MSPAPACRLKPVVDSGISRCHYLLGDLDAVAGLLPRFARGFRGWVSRGSRTRAGWRVQLARADLALEAAGGLGHGTRSAVGGLPCHSVSSAGCRGGVAGARAAIRRLNWATGTSQHGWLGCAPSACARSACARSASGWRRPAPRARMQPQGRTRRAGSRPGARHSGPPRTLPAEPGPIGRRRYQRKWTKTRPKFLESFSTRW
jgi:hypothetical protein